MKTVNRAALLVRPREPFIEWAANVDEKARQAAQELRGNTSVYLVPEDLTGRDEAAPLKHFFERIFEAELEAWNADSSAWPQNRDLATFKKWFEVYAQSIVVDLAAGRPALRSENL